MRRRKFITLLGGAAFAHPLTASAQPAKKLPVVAFVSAETPLAIVAGPDAVGRDVRAFVHGLADLGWVEDRTIVIEWPSAAGQPERVPAIVADLVVRRAAVIVIGSTKWLQDEVRRATRDIPIVAVLGGDPVAEGRIVSLGRPGGNLTGVTGTTGYELLGKRLQLLKELAPGVSRVAVLGQRQELEAHRSNADALGITGIFVEIDRAEQLEDALATILRQRADAVHILGGFVLYARTSRIVAFATEHRLPTMFGARVSVEAGGLMSYGASVPGLFRQMAGYVDRILKGAKPTDLAVQQPTKFEMVINMKTAKALCLVIPPLMLAQADEVIE